MKWKWKTALKPHEAVLFAADLEGYDTITGARELWDTFQPAPPPAGLAAAGEADWGPFDDWEAEGEKITLAEEIYDALLQEIELADPYEQYQSDVGSVLEIAQRAQYSEDEDYIVAARCTVTKLSLAKWFWQHDHDIARKFWPSISEEIVYPSQEPKSKNQNSGGPSSKAKNSYLKTISILSEALVDGLTGKPSTDAITVLAALAEKSIEAPIGEKTLANYLKQASEL